MLFSKKGRQKPDAAAGPKDLSPVLHAADSLKSYQKELAHREVEALTELQQVGLSFSGVMHEADQFQEQLQGFGASFANVNGVAEQYTQVREEIGQTVSAAQSNVETLRDTSIQVEQAYHEMENTFTQLENAITEIRQCMDKIVNIADETNILAINASIEAARAGEKGKGFAVVAAKVKKLAEEIKGLMDEVDSGVYDVENGAKQLYGSIEDSRQVLGQSIETANTTYDSFHHIITAAERSVAVQSEISDVISSSQQSLHTICQFFDSMKQQYQEVTKHLHRASILGTLKSGMFEDMDNMLSQIPPIIQDYESKES